MATRKRHAAHFGKPSEAHAETESETDFARWKALLEASYHDVVSAAVWLAKQPDLEISSLVEAIVNINQYVSFDHRYPEARSTYSDIRDALQTRPAADPQVRWLIAVCTSRIAYTDIGLHLYDRALAEIEAALPEAHQVKNKRLISFCHQLLALIWHRKGQYDQARHHIKESLLFVEGDNNKEVSYTSYRLLCRLALHAGWLDVAEEAAKASSDLSQERGRKMDQSQPFHDVTIGLAAHRRGKLAQALALLEATYVPMKQADQTGFIVKMFTGLIQVSADLGDKSRWDRYLGEGCEYTNKIGDAFFKAQIGLAAGIGYTLWREWEPALGELNDVISRQIGLGIMAGLAEAYAYRGYVKNQLGNQVAALADIEQSLTLCDEQKLTGVRALPLLMRGRWHWAVNQLAEAERDFTQGVAWGMPASEHYYAVQAQVELGLLWRAMGAAQKAKETLDYCLKQEALTTRDRERIGKD